MQGQGQTGQTDAASSKMPLSLSYLSGLRFKKQMHSRKRVQLPCQLPGRLLLFSITKLVLRNKINKVGAFYRWSRGDEVQKPQLGVTELGCGLHEATSPRTLGPPRKSGTWIHNCSRVRVCRAPVPTTPSPGHPDHTCPLFGWPGSHRVIVVCTPAPRTAVLTLSALRKGHSIRPRHICRPRSTSQRPVSGRPAVPSLPTTPPGAGAGPLCGNVHVSAGGRRHPTSQDGGSRFLCKAGDCHSLQCTCLPLSVPRPRLHAPLGCDGGPSPSRAGTARAGARPRERAFLKAPKSTPPARQPLGGPQRHPNPTGRVSSPVGAVPIWEVGREGLVILPPPTSRGPPRQTSPVLSTGPLSARPANSRGSQDEPGRPHRRRLSLSATRPHSLWVHSGERVIHTQKLPDFEGTLENLLEEKILLTAGI